MDKCEYCNHTKKFNKHGIDMSDFEYDPEKDEAVYVGSCVYCRICNPNEEFTKYILGKMRPEEYRSLTADEQSELFLKFTKETT